MMDVLAVFLYGVFAFNLGFLAHAIFFHRERRSEPELRAEAERIDAELRAQGYLRGRDDA